ncbi:uncharacterized protein LOC120539766 [Polypterus senegalus]|uniref:uncharacterized protein LOC120539766 n=2 Tax=Polypterus senegalus TaxID=55291 RepID=UPI0019668625|nr:uncharacterized protein LOC120539766 [Polypterus senegalus]
MFQILKQKYQLRARRSDVMKLMSEMNPSGTRARRIRRFFRRSYHSLGPNYVWHVDGNDKLKPYGFAVSGCIDGFSRKILWLTCGPTNNNPAVVASNYMKVIYDLRVVPMRLRTDCGTENGIMAAMQCALRSHHSDRFSGEASHIYGTSTSNQRIESWWAQYRKQRSQFWMDLFEDLKDLGHFNGSHEHKCLLRFCFTDILQKDLEECKQLWNQHRIRPSRMSTCPPGIPNELYSLPHRFWSRDCGFHVAQQQLQDLRDQCETVGLCGDEDIQDYLTYVKEQYDLQTPQVWEDALDLFFKLKEKTNV